MHNSWPLDPNVPWIRIADYAPGNILIIMRLTLFIDWIVSLAISAGEKKHFSPTRWNLKSRKFIFRDESRSFLVLNSFLKRYSTSRGRAEGRGKKRSPSASLLGKFSSAHRRSILKYRFFCQTDCFSIGSGQPSLVFCDTKGDFK